MAAEDGPAWQALFASVGDEGLWIGAEAPVPDRSQEIVEQYVGSETDVVFMAYAGEQTVGWIGAEVVKDGRVELGMGIIDGFRGQGIGSALMEAAIAWAEPRTIFLRVFPHNERAIGLYRKFGFVAREQQAGVWPRRNGDFWDLLFMQRQPGAQ
jgi:ribosomal protein S18 acetylase RimI-like enzyme